MAVIFYSFEDVMEGGGEDVQEALETIDVATILATLTEAGVVGRAELIDRIHESFFLSFDPNERQIVATGTIRNYLVPLRRFYAGLNIPVGVFLGPDHLTDRNMSTFIDAEAVRLNHSSAFKMVSAAFNWILTMIALPRLHGTAGAYPLSVLAIRSWIFVHRMAGIVPKSADGFKAEAVKYIMELPMDPEDNCELLNRTIYVLQVLSFSHLKLHCNM